MLLPEEINWYIDHEKGVYECAGYSIETCGALYIDKIDGIRLSTRPDCIDDYVLTQLKKYGVTAIELGAQSMSEDVLLRSNRGHTSDDTRRAAKLIRDHGFSLVLQMMTGLPGDDRETSVYTARELIALKPDGVRIYPAVVLPRTKMWDMAEEGTYIPQSVDEAVGVCSEIIPMFVREGISVLRVGLMDNEILAGGNVKGAYHPALGELCYAEVFYNAARQILLGTSFSNVSIEVPKGAVSKMTGHKGRNTQRLKDEFAISMLKVRERDELKGFEVKITAI